jgi:FixJ family two-component response regulator
MSGMTKPVEKVFIVDDDASFLRSIERLLRSAGYATECFISAEEFLVQRPSTAAGCVLADLQMPGMDGLAFQAALAQSAVPLPIVFLTGHGDIPISVAAMRQGAEDFLVKTAPKELVIAAIERALARNARERITLTRRQRLQSRFEKLTPREHEVLFHVMQGKRNRRIADDLGIDERSVKRHRTNLMRKLGVTSVAELVQLAVESGRPAAG